MNKTELKSLIATGEDSRHQFKKNVANADALAAEMVAFSNADGGVIFIGVNDDGGIEGLSLGDVQRLNQFVSNAASQCVVPAINPQTENVETENGIVIVVTVPAGLNKPYQDKGGTFWVKSGADKRKATSREEIQRMFQSANLLHADEMPVAGTSVEEIDRVYFNLYFMKRYGSSVDEQMLPLADILKNMNLAVDGMLNVSGALLFMEEPQRRLPMFMVKAGAFNSNDIATSGYSDSRDIVGKLCDVFRQSVSFIINNLHHLQGDQNVNSVGQPEIPVGCVEELVANALIHRDYFISAPVRIFVFTDRVEIISPGHLPNNLTVANIKSGNSNSRNPVLASFANYALPYRGFGSGIIRALSLYKDIEFLDDRDRNLFVVTIKRKAFCSS